MSLRMSGCISAVIRRCIPRVWGLRSITAERSVALDGARHAARRHAVRTGRVVLCAPRVAPADARYTVRTAHRTPAHSTRHRMRRTVYVHVVDTCILIHRCRFTSRARFLFSCDATTSERMSGCISAVIRRCIPRGWGLRSTTAERSVALDGARSGQGTSCATRVYSCSRRRARRSLDLVRSARIRFACFGVGLHCFTL